MKLLIPNKRDRFRLVNDLDVGGVPRVLPAGTVFRIDKTRINQATRDNEPVYCTVLASPNPEIAMKKYGGTSSFGKFFVMKNNDLRNVEVEIVEGMD